MPQLNIVATMANNKNQHYVPQCYLRNFAETTERKTISVFNIDRGATFSGASIKGQCSRPYFYGNDNRFEAGFLSIEGKYAGLTRKILNGDELTNEEDVHLRIFMMIQLFRTPTTVEKIQEQRAAFQNAIFGTRPVPEDWRPREEEAIDTAVFAGLEAIFLIAHTRLVFLRTPKNRVFLTSDNPVAFINKYHQQRLNERNYGYGNAGALFTLPISPNICAVYYDPLAYAVPRSGTSKYIDAHAGDVDKINAGTFIFSYKNLYSTSPMQEYCAEIKKNYSNLKADFRSETLTLGLVEGTTDRWQVIESDEKPRESIVTSSFYYPKFAANYRFLKHRTGFIPFDTYSMAGKFSDEKTHLYIERNRNKPRERIDQR